MTNKERTYEIARVIILLVITLIVLAWTLVNADGFILPAFMFMVMAFISIGWILVFNKFGKKIRLIGIDKNSGFDFLVGIGVGVGMVVLTFFNVIGSVILPYVPASFTTDAGRIAITVIGAGVIESVFFFMLMIQFLDEKLDAFRINLPFVIATSISAFVFAFFHYYTYTLAGGSISSVFGSFISVFVVSFIWAYTMKWTKSILPLIISHFIINFWILNLTFKWISFGG